MHDFWDLLQIVQGGKANKKTPRLAKGKAACQGYIGVDFRKKLPFLRRSPT
jgi:hypothetical protein